MNYNGLSTQIIAVDSSGEKLCPSLEATYGPYDSIDTAYNSIVNEFDTDGIPIGLTVGIITDSTIKEYWFNGGTDKAHLVEKINSSSGGSTSIETIPTSSINTLFK